MLGTLSAVYTLSIAPHRGRGVGIIFRFGKDNGKRGGALEFSQVGANFIKLSGCFDCGFHEGVGQAFRKERTFPASFCQK